MILSDMAKIGELKLSGVLIVYFDSVGPTSAIAYTFMPLGPTLMRVSYIRRDTSVNWSTLALAHKSLF